MNRAFCLCLLLLSIGCESSEPVPLYVGHLSPVEGPNRSEVSGIELAVEQWNADPANMPHNRRLLVMHGEVGRDPKEFLAQAVRLAEVNEVHAVFGGPFPSAARDMSQAARDAEVTMIATAGVGASSRNGFFFPIGIAPEERGRILAEHAISDVNMKRAALVIDPEYPSATDIAEGFRATFRGEGRTVRDQPLSSSLSAKEEYQLVILITHAERALEWWVAREPTNPNDGGPQLGFAGDEHESPMLLEGGVPFLHVRAFTPEDKSERSAAFVREYRDKFGNEPDSAAALGYEAIGIYSQALRKTEEPEDVEIRKKLDAETFEVLSGELRFTKDRSPRRPAFVCQIKDGKSVLLKRYESGEK